MPKKNIPPETSAADAFVRFIGERAWTARLAAIGQAVASGPRTGRVAAQRHGIVLALERLRRRGGAPAGFAGPRIARLAAEAVRIAAELPAAGRERLHAVLLADATLAAPFHLLRTAMLQRSRGFEVRFAGFEDAAPFDLLLRRDGAAAEVACDVVSAEEGRDVHRGAWFSLVDRIDPELQTWLAAHPGRYLLKMTLPHGLRPGEDGLAALHHRIRALLAEPGRAAQDEAAVLRLDPLLLAGAQASELGLMSRLQQEFGPEAHLAVTAAGSGVFVMAARAGRENEVAAAVRRRLSAVAPARLTGTRPGILAMLIEDTDRLEWQTLRDQLELEGETRRFMTHPEARPVVAVTCASRLELLGAPEPGAAPDGELRYRNPSHPAARLAALAPAVLSSL